MKIRLMAVLTFVAASCILGSIEVRGARYSQVEEVVENRSDSKQKTALKITIIDDVKEVRQTTIDEYSSGTARVNIVIDDQYLPVEDSSYSDKSLDGFRLNNIRFAVPDGGSRGFGYPVFATDYMSEREEEKLKEWNSMYAAVGGDCPECNDGVDAAREWIAEGNLQKPIEKYLKQYPEILSVEREYVLRVTSAEETYRVEDDTSWWEVDFYLYTQKDNGESVCIGFGDIYRTVLAGGEPVWYDDAEYRILEQNSSMWKLLEKPEEDRGEIWIDFIEDDPEEEGFSVFYSVPDENKEEWVENYLMQYGEKFLLPSGVKQEIQWMCHREEDFWYDYIVCNGETSEYELKVEIPLMPAGSGNWYMASRIRKEAEDKEMCTETLAVMRKTFHAVPYDHMVKKGDTLSGIAEKYLEDDRGYVRLAYENMIQEPDLIYPGEVITISP